MTAIAFCYICFEGNRTLKDLLKSEEECLELMAKLRVCVSEVDWSLNKNLLVCDRCIKKLNKAHEFKKQCIQSSETLKLYLSELKKTKDKQVEKKEEPLVLQYLNLMKDDKSLKKPPIVVKAPAEPQQPPAYPAITKIILTQQPNSFPNVFLNIIPQNKKIDDKTPMLNLSNVIQFTQSPPPLIMTKNKTENKEEGAELSKLLTEVKTEEVSVEIDPLDISMEQQVNNFRPILPKAQDSEKPQQGGYDYTNEEKMEFFNSGHFLLQDIEKTNKFYCDKCLIRFESAVTLHKHMMSVHSAQYPYKCDYCGAEFASKSMHKQHVNNHCDEMSELLTDSITLTDFTTNNPKINDIIKPPEPTEEEAKISPEIKHEINDVKCDECDRGFISYQGLIRHKAKVHKSYQRKKYFIKGMKNAKCDICNRMFSTTSYLNLHRKLHERKGVWRRKIYKPDNAEESQEILDNSEVEVEMEEEEEEVVVEPESVSKSKLLLMDQDVEIIPYNTANTNNTSAKDDTPPPHKCQYCGDQQEDAKTLQRHIDKTHLKSTQYKCQYCEDAFKLGIHLVKHLSIHTNATCGTCNQTFANTGQLKAHIASNHNGKCRKKGRCGLCDKTFDDIGDLEGHIDEHISVYKCQMCSKQFRECLELTRHLMEHNTSRRKTIQLSDEIEAIPIHQ